MPPPSRPISEDPIDALTRPQFAICLIYALALPSSAWLVFGELGFLLGWLGVIAWGIVFVSAYRLAVFFGLVLATPLVGLGVLVTLSCNTREASRTWSCGYHLRLLGVAIHNYHDEFGSLPPAWQHDADGRRTQSWRTLILPYLDQQELFESLARNEPWNSPVNSAVLPRMPSVYSCPSHTSTAAPHPKTPITSFVAVVGPNTAWPPGQFLNLGDLTDGTSETILLIEQTREEIPWMEPRDIEDQDALELLTAPPGQLRDGHRHEGLLTKPVTTGRHVLFADGSVRFLPTGLPPATARALLTARSGDSVPNHFDEAASDSPDQPIYDGGKCAKFALLIFVIAFPLPWVFRPTVQRCEAFSGGTGGVVRSR